MYTLYTQEDILYKEVKKTFHNHSFNNGWERLSTNLQAFGGGRGVWVWGGMCVCGRGVCVVGVCVGVWVGVGGWGVGVFVCTIRMFPTYPQYNSTDIPTSAHTHNI